MSDIETLPNPGKTQTLPRTLPQTQTLPVTQTPTPRLSNDNGDHERFAHYARKDKIVEASVMGTPITALCGKVWVPSRDPSRFPVCPECKDIYGHLLTGGSKSSR